MKKLMITTAAVLATATAAFAANPQLENRVSAELQDRGFSYSATDLTDSQVVEIFLIVNGSNDSPFNNEGKEVFSHVVNTAIQGVIEDAS